MNRRHFTIALFAGGSQALRAWGEEPPGGLPNLKAPTAGGRHFWGDAEFFRNWRIQRNVVTKHYRLLNEKDVRHAWGSLEACRAKLEEIKKLENLPPMEGEAVLLLHGLSRNRRHMHKLGEYLTKEGGLQVYNFGYPSSRAGVEQHARQLAGAIESLKGIERIHFVAHSLGNLVIRRWMTLNLDPATQEPRDRRVGRFVMLGPPNHRPSMARIFVPIDPGNLIAGQAGHDLNSDWDKLAPKLATPAGEFGILAGGKANDSGWNPLIPGDDDAIVGVDEARLKGASDFRVVKVIHRSMPTTRAIQQLTLAYLQTGRFGEESQRQRIE